MKKLFFLAPAIILLSCSTDSDEIEQDIENNQLNINFQDFTIDEHSEPGSVIGTITASGPDKDDLTFLTFIQKK